MADEAKGTEGVEERVKSLEEALSLEKAKNEVLMEQILKSENTLAEKDIEGFADVIPNEDRDFWRGQLLENREAAVGILNRMRGRVAPVVKSEVAVAAGAVPPVAVPPVAVPSVKLTFTVNPPATARDVPGKFTGPFKMVALPGVGHFPQRENPEAVTRHLMDLFVEAKAEHRPWKIAAGVAALLLLIVQQRWLFPQGKILIQAAACRCIDQLKATADAQHRLVGLLCILVHPFPEYICLYIYAS